LELPDEALERIESGELSEGHGRAILLCKDHAARRRLALAARDGSWSVRETERRARAMESGPDPRPETRVVHPDLEEAIAAAEDALSAALGREVAVRPRGDGCRVQFHLQSAAEAVELAERILAGGRRESPAQPA
ncbi:MAG: chromosome partitioning protein ParB, partial [Actinomycetota bacterium]|nr:chromosome partitioning protein ParB [Actinomycetota bacterium]